MAKKEYRYETRVFADPKLGCPPIQIRHRFDRVLAADNPKSFEAWVADPTVEDLDKFPKTYLGTLARKQIGIHHRGLLDRERNPSEGSAAKEAAIQLAVNINTATAMYAFHNHRELVDKTPKNERKALYERLWLDYEEAIREEFSEYFTDETDA